jgi:hypothetical protein
MLIAFATALLLAQAPPKDPLLRRGAALFDTLDFDNAKVAYERALSVRLASSDEVVEAYLGVGLCEATLGNEDAARAAFVKALALKPDARLEGADISPRQRAPFDAARSEAGGRAALRVDHLPPRDFLAGAPVKLAVSVGNDWQALVAGVRLLFRRDGQPTYEEVTYVGPKPYEVSLPPLGVGPVEYNLQAIDVHGSPVAQWHRVDDPQHVALSDVTDGPPLYTRPWVWGVAGGVVVAAVIAGVLASTLQPPDYQVKTRTGP